jgi:peptidoglycan/LPS O-acetylase OafA/YrhL
MEKSFFTNKYTNFAKGIAILLMLFHHLGLDPGLNIFANSLIFTNFALQCKICVSIFVILSGYGLNSSINRKNELKQSKTNLIGLIKFASHHLIKMMSGYWVIFILFLSFGCISGIRNLEIYGVHLFRNLCIDFLGLATFFSTPTYNATWWFMSLIIILYIVFPICKIMLERSPIALLLLACIISWFPIANFYSGFNRYANIYSAFNLYALIFCLGMIFSEFKIFDRIRSLNKFKSDEIILSIVFLMGVIIKYKFVITYRFQSIFEILATVSIILACNNILADIPIFNNVLELLGKHSANIFMIHTFIYYYFFNDFFRYLKYPAVMYFVLVASSLSISVLIEKGKEYIKNMYVNLNQKTSNQKWRVSK